MNQKVDHFIIYFTLILFLIFSYILYSIAIDSYNISRHEVSRASFKNYLPREDKNLVDSWVNPGARIVSRIYYQESDNLINLADRLSVNSSAYDVWVKSGSELYEVDSFLLLSLMTGDLTSGYLIIKEAVKKNDHEENNHHEQFWLHTLTDTYWQGANGYLHELDFGRSSLYNNLYLATSRLITGSRDSGEIVLERSRTISHILQREFLTSRIKSMCNDPGVSRSFSRLINSWDEYIYRDLLERRALNYNFHCTGNNTETVPYNYIANLNDKEIPLSACELWPLECNFKKLSKLIFSGEHNLIANDVFNFNDECSYLSDDLLFWFITEMIHREEILEENFKFKIPISTIQKTLSCSTKIKGDWHYQLQTLVNSLSCDKVNFDRYSGLPDHTPKLRARCGY